MKWAPIFITILLASAAMLLPAFFNGFPLVYSDTGAYIASGFEGKVPGDRPIFYGLFLRHASLAHSLWFVVAAQALLISALLLYIFKSLLSDTDFSLPRFVFLILGLILFSSLPWFSGMLMADVFTSLSFLLLFVLLFKTPANLWISSGLVLFYWLATGTHLTNFPAHLALLVGIGFFKLFKLHILKGLSWLKWSLVLILVAANSIVVPAVHYAFDGGYVMSKNGHLFLTARLIESGALPSYLHDNCNEKPNFLCAFKDSLPNNGSDFLWLPNSLLYKTGGWDSNAVAYKHINQTVLTTPKYFAIYFDHFLQVLKFHITAHKIGEELIPLGQNSPPGWETEAHFKEELSQLISSKQAQNYFSGKLNGLNQIISWVLLLSILLNIFFLFSKRLNVRIRLFILSLCIVYLGNFFAVCIASSGSRYNARLDWLFVFIAALSLIAFFRKSLESRI